MPNSDFSRTRLTYLEAWPHSLLSRAAKTSTIKMLRTERDRLIELADDPSPRWSRLPTRLEEAIYSVLLMRSESALALQVVIGLGSGMPTDRWQQRNVPDSYTAGRNCVSRALAEIVQSPKMQADLRLAQFNGYNPAIAVRQHIQIVPGSEFRLFVTGGNLVAASLIDDYSPYSEAFMRKEIHALWEGHLREALHLDDCTVDIAWQSDWGDHLVWHVIDLGVYPPPKDKLGLFGQNEAALWTPDQPEREIRVLLK